MCLGSVVVVVAVAVVQPPNATCGPTQSNPTPTPKLSRNQPKSASDPRRGGESPTTATATTTKRMWVILNWCHFPLPFLVNCNKAARAGQKEVRGDSERHPVDEENGGRRRGGERVHFVVALLLLLLLLLLLFVNYKITKANRKPKKADSNNNKQPKRKLVRKETKKQQHTQQQQQELRGISNTSANCRKCKWLLRPKVYTGRERKKERETVFVCFIEIVLPVISASEQHQV